jgi:hypothetical protein
LSQKQRLSGLGMRALEKLDNVLEPFFEHF